MKLINEVLKCNTDKAFLFICIGKKFQNIFKNITLPFYLNYCRKYKINIIVINNYIDKYYYKHLNYKKDPGYQRLLAPELIKLKFPKIKYLCDIDVDCVPGNLSRNIFSYHKNIKKNEIILVKPKPKNFTSSNIGKRISLLRKLYLDKKFPLNSLIISSDKNISKTFGYKYRGPIPTIGTCLGYTDTLAKHGRLIYENIKLDKKFFYLQTYRANYYKNNLKIKWLPYEFQAIWSYELALYFPFVIHKKFRKYFNEFIMSTLNRVDFLHFAGSWPENKFFQKISNNDKGILSEYFDKLDEYLQRKIKPFSYGKIKYNKIFKI